MSFEENIFYFSFILSFWNFCSSFIQLTVVIKSSLLKSISEGTFLPQKPPPLLQCNNVIVAEFITVPLFKVKYCGKSPYIWPSEGTEKSTTIMKRLTHFCLLVWWFSLPCALSFSQLWFYFSSCLGFVTFLCFVSLCVLVMCYFSYVFCITVSWCVVFPHAFCSLCSGSLCWPCVFLPCGCPYVFHLCPQ